MWLNDNSGAIQAIASVAVVGLTAVLAWYAKLTRAAVSAATRSADAAEAAIEEARGANELAARGFGADLVVQRQTDNVFVIANVGPGLARNVIADFHVEDQAVGDTPQQVAPWLAGRSGPVEALGINWMTKALQSPTTYQWPPTNMGWPPPGAVPARVCIRFDDAFRREARVFSDVFYLWPPGKPQQP